jgi:opacity protein-like surface antigen
MKTRTYVAAAGTALALALALPAGAIDPDRGLYINAESGPNWASDVSVGGGGHEEMDVGFRFATGVGYNLNKYIGFEFDGGWVYNEFKHIDGSLSHIPMIGNAVFRYPIASRWEVYGGGGLGTAISILDTENETDAEFEFAWQLLAGVRFKIKEYISLGVGYKYFGTAKAHFDQATLGNIQNHSILACFNMKF